MGPSSRFSDDIGPRGHRIRVSPDRASHASGNGNDAHEAALGHVSVRPLQACRHDVLKYQIKRTSYLWLHSLGPCSRNTGRQGCKLDTNPIGMIEDQLSRKAHPSLPEFLAELWILQPFMKRSAAVLFMQCLIV